MGLRGQEDVSALGKVPDGEIDMGGVFEVNKRFNGQTYHFWPRTFKSKVGAQKFAVELRNKGYKVRVVGPNLGLWQPFTRPAQRLVDM